MSPFKDHTNLLCVELAFTSVDCIYNLKFGGTSKPNLISVHSGLLVRFYSVQDLCLRFEAQIKLPAKPFHVSASISYILILCDDRRIVAVNRNSFEIITEKRTPKQLFCSCYDNIRSWFIVGGVEGFDALVRPNLNFQVEPLS